MATAKVDGLASSSQRGDPRVVAKKLSAHVAGLGAQLQNLKVENAQLKRRLEAVRYTYMLTHVVLDRLATVPSGGGAPGCRWTACAEALRQLESQVDPLLGAWPRQLDMTGQHSAPNPQPAPKNLQPEEVAASTAAGTIFHFNIDPMQTLASCFDRVDFSTSTELADLAAFKQRRKVGRKDAALLLLCRVYASTPAEVLAADTAIMEHVSRDSHIDLSLLLLHPSVIMRTVTTNQQTGSMQEIPPEHSQRLVQQLQLDDWQAAQIVELWSVHEQLRAPLMEQCSGLQTHLASRSSTMSHVLGPGAASSSNNPSGASTPAGAAGAASTATATECDPHATAGSAEGITPSNDASMVEKLNSNLHKYAWLSWCFSHLVGCTLTAQQMATMFVSSHPFGVSIGHWACYLKRNYHTPALWRAAPQPPQQQQQQGQRQGRLQSGVLAQLGAAWQWQQLQQQQQRQLGYLVAVSQAPALAASHQQPLRHYHQQQQQPQQPLFLPSSAGLGDAGASPMQLSSAGAAALSGGVPHPGPAPGHYQVQLDGSNGLQHSGSQGSRSDGSSLQVGVGAPIAAGAGAVLPVAPSIREQLHPQLLWQAAVQERCNGPQHQQQNAFPPGQSYSRPPQQVLLPAASGSHHYQQQQQQQQQQQRWQLEQQEARGRSLGSSGLLAAGWQSAGVHPPHQQQQPLRPMLMPIAAGGVQAPGAQPTVAAQQQPQAHAADRLVGALEQQLPGSQGLVTAPHWAALPEQGVPVVHLPCMAQQDARVPLINALQLQGDSQQLLQAQQPVAQYLPGALDQGLLSQGTLPQLQQVALPLSQAPAQQQHHQLQQVSLPLSQAPAQHYQQQPSAGPLQHHHQPLHPPCSAPHPQQQQQQQHPHNPQQLQQVPAASAASSVMPANWPGELPAPPDAFAFDGPAWQQQMEELPAGLLDALLDEMLGEASALPGIDTAPE